MAQRTLFSIDGTISVDHCPGERALIGHWQSLCSPQFRAALEKAMAEAGRVGAVTWIVDLTSNPGVPSQADLAWIESTAVMLAKRNGVRAIVNVHGASQVATMGSKRWSKSASDGGMSTYDCASLSDALQLASDIASGKAA
ncbi:MAG: hypothetical protein ACHQ6T_02705 [Myxococcota bacterium]